MEGNSMLRENEKQANRLVAKVMRITFLIFTLVYVLDLTGIFKVDTLIMTIAYVGGSALLLLPTLLVNVLKREAAYIKYLCVISATVLVTLLSITLTYHVVVMYVYPIAIASLYFSKRLNVAATSLTVAGVSAGQILAFYLQTLQDDNFTDMKRVLIFGVLPRALVLVAIAAIFTMLCSRTAEMLSNLLGAEEQKKMVEHMKKMQESAAKTSDALYSMVNQLSDITENSLKANQMIAKESANLLAGTMENTQAVEMADENMQDITKQLSDLSAMNHNAAALTVKIGENTRENQKRMNDATEGMEQIHESTNACKQIIHSLGEESKEIIGIVQTITGISSKTNILALNASIEAARAGDHGKGFAVVAEEIQKLAEQTKTAVENIGIIVHQVVENTEDAVRAMEENAFLTRNGMASIKKANESALLITASNEEMVAQVQAIDATAEVIRQKSGEVSDSMQQISNNTHKNCNAVEQVNGATQENTAGTESLADIVEDIKGLSGQLKQVMVS